MSTKTARQSSNLAHLLAHLISEFFISLSHLKIVDFFSLDGPLTVFFMALFKTILKAPRNVLGGVFQRISATAGLQDVRDAIIVFLNRHLIDQGVNDEIAFAERCMDRADLLEAI